MDVVVYVKGGENESLRYAVRTWCKNLTFDKLCVVGGPKPKWLQPDIYIENATTLSKMPQCYSNVRLAMADDRLSDDVILMMDDVFLINYVGKWQKNYNRGTLLAQHERSISLYGDNAYASQIKHTHDFLSKTFDNPLSFEEHAPFVCNRKRMSKILGLIKPEMVNFLLYRSIYGNMYGLSTDCKRDIKLQTGSDTFSSRDLVISTSQTSFRGAAGRVIQSWYPDPSKYEK